MFCLRIESRATSVINKKGYYSIWLIFNVHLLQAVSYVLCAILICIYCTQLAMYYMSYWATIFNIKAPVYKTDERKIELCFVGLFIRVPALMGSLSGAGIGSNVENTGSHLIISRQLPLALHWCAA